VVDKLFLKRLLLH